MPVDQLRCQYPELAHEKLVPVNVIDDGETLSSFAEGSCDFVIANHLIEHCQDPISALSHWLRVLRPDGILYSAFPDKEYTFDKERETTSLVHLMEDREKGSARSRWQHYLDWARYVNHTPEGKVEERARTLSEMNYSIHFHVWTTPEFLQFI